MTYTSYRGRPAKALVMQRQSRISTKKFWTRHRQDHTQLEERLRQSPTSTSRPESWAKFQHRICATYDHFKDVKEGSCKEALAIEQDTHLWVLAAMALLEDKIRRLSHSLSCGCWHSRSHSCLGSHHQRSQAGSHQDRAPQVEACQGESSKRWAQSPSPRQLRRCVTFEDNSKEDSEAGDPCPLTWGDTEKTRMEEEDLEDLAPLDPYLEGFLARAEGGDDSQQTLPPKPSHNNSSEWVTWCAKQLDTLTWWQEFSKVPGQNDIQQFVRRVWASFQLPKMSSHA